MNSRLSKMVLLYAWLMASASGCFFASDSGFGSDESGGNGNSANTSNDPFHGNFSGPGSFDLDFIENVSAGILPDPMNPNFKRRINAMKYSEDDKIIVAGGQCEDVTCETMNTFVAKLELDGRLDSSFGDNGVVSFDFYFKLYSASLSSEPIDDYVIDMVLGHTQSPNEEKIILLGYTEYPWPTGPQRQLGLAVLNMDGSPLISFDQNVGVYPLVGFEFLESGGGGIPTSATGKLAITTNGTIHSLYEESPGNMILNRIDIDTALSIGLVHQHLNFQPIILGDPSYPKGITDMQIYEELDGTSSLYILAPLGMLPNSGPPAYSTVIARYSSITLASDDPAFPTNQLSWDGPPGMNSSRPWAMRFIDTRLQVLMDYSNQDSGWSIFQGADAGLSVFSHALAPLANGQSELIQTILSTGNPFFPYSPLSDAAAGGIAYHANVEKYAVTGVTNDNQLFFVRYNVDNSIDSTYGPDGSGFTRLPLGAGHLLNNPADWDMLFNSDTDTLNSAIKSLMLPDGSVLASALLKQNGVVYDVFVKLNSQ